jgi:hypothetical protein
MKCSLVLKWVSTTNPLHCTITRYVMFLVICTMFCTLVMWSWQLGVCHHTLVQWHWVSLLFCYVTHLTTKYECEGKGKVVFILSTSHNRSTGWLQYYYYHNTTYHGSYYYYHSNLVCVILSNDTESTLVTTTANIIVLPVVVLTLQ